MLEKFRLYTEGHPITLYTDHKPLQYIFENPDSKPKLVRWALRLQQYDLTIEYIKGKANVVADAASRLPVGSPSAPMDDEVFELGHDLPQGLARSGRVAMEVRASDSSLTTAGRVGAMPCPGQVGGLLGS